MVGEIEILKILADWGWAAAGTCAAGAGAMVLGRISSLEKKVDTKAPNEDLKLLSAKHDSLRDDMHKLFREQSTAINSRFDQVMGALIRPPA